MRWGEDAYFRGLSTEGLGKLCPFLTCVAKAAWQVALHVLLTLLPQFLCWCGFGSTWGTQEIQASSKCNTQILSRARVYSFFQDLFLFTKPDVSVPPSLYWGCSAISFSSEVCSSKDLMSHLQKWVRRSQYLSGRSKPFDRSVYQRIRLVCPGLFSRWLFEWPAP